MKRTSICSKRVQVPSSAHLGANVILMTILVGEHVFVSSLSSNFTCRVLKFIF